MAASDDTFLDQLLQGMTSALGVAPRGEAGDEAGPSTSAPQVPEGARLKWCPDLRLPVSGSREATPAAKGVGDLTKQVRSDLGHGVPPSVWHA